MKDTIQKLQEEFDEAELHDDREQLRELIDESSINGSIPTAHSTPSKSS
jgi:hypothetical protein